MRERSSARRSFLVGRPFPSKLGDFWSGASSFGSSYPSTALRLGGRPATLAKLRSTRQPDTTRVPAERSEHPRDPPACAGFRIPVSVHAHMPAADLFGGQAAGLEEPRLPQPFVDPQSIPWPRPWRRVSCRLSNPSAQLQTGCPDRWPFPFLGGRDEKVLAPLWLATLLALFATGLP